MRFMVLIKANADSEAGIFPTRELLEAMGRFNEEMARAGVLIGGEGLHPSARGTRLSFTGRGDVTVTDGPFTETKELIAGFWIIQTASRDEAIAWIKRVPQCPGGGEIEIRQIFEASDFPAHLFPAEEAAREQALRDELQKIAALA
jgi:hypothetical protein